MSNLVTINNGTVTTNSLLIADTFEKRHDLLLRDIKKLIQQLPNDWGILNFEETPYTNLQNGQTYPMYTLTRDAFTLLAMGFTGKKAMQFKLAYIEAFNKMEAELQNKQQALPSAKSLPPAKPKLPPLMIEYEPQLWEEQHAEKLINNFHYKDYAYNSYMLSCKANALFNEFEEKIKELMQDYDRLSEPVYKEMLGRVMERPYDDLLDTSSLNTKEERNRHNEFAEFTSQMWETLCRTRNNLTYRKDELRNEVQHSIRTLVSIAKILDM